MCVLCVLSKKNQFDLRASAQNSTDGFEFTLEFYKKVFIREFENSIKSDVCDKHKDIMVSFKEEDIKKEVISIFEHFQKAYLLWINNDTIKANNTVSKVFKKYNLFNSIKINNLLMYRARKSNIRLSRLEMFHIPFNKRYLIENQRYSLVGRPMLYLGNSPTYTMEEIGFNINETNTDCYISGFYVKNNENLNICDLRYRFVDNVSRQVLDKLDGTSITLDKTDLYVSIISSLCSFQRKHIKNVFCEEYVLPQIVSEVVYKKNFDGLMYTSTKLLDNNDNTIIGEFDDVNTALFTKYKKSGCEKPYLYDEELYDKFWITSSKSILQIQSMEYDVMRNIIQTGISNKEIPRNITEMINYQVSQILKKDGKSLETKICTDIVYEILVNLY